MRTLWRCGGAGALVLMLVPGLFTQTGRQAAPRAGGADRINYLTFAQGAVPVRVGGAGARLGASFEHAMRIVDGDPAAFSFVNGASASTDTEFVYELPALTIFDRLAVPGIMETPSPTLTFTKTVEVHGSATSATSGFVLLGSTVLQAQRTRGQVTEIPIAARPAVRWIRLRLIGGLDIQRSASTFEFSEIVGNGTQETPIAVSLFRGSWQDRGASVRLRQTGGVVSGCYDTQGDLHGTVTGTILRATGVDRVDSTRSAFIVSVGGDGSLRGMRSTNNGPSRLFTIPVAPAGAVMSCGLPPPPRLSCGSIVHGIAFNAAAAGIRPESAPILAALADGLRAAASRAIVIEGHTSSEGEDDYNLRLSERRAEAVVGDLVRRGIGRNRLRGVGIGERRPIASNADAGGRSLNERVEIKCQ